MKNDLINDYGTATKLTSIDKRIKLVKRNHLNSFKKKFHSVIFVSPEPTEGYQIIWQRNNSVMKASAIQ